MEQAPPPPPSPVVASSIRGVGSDLISKDALNAASEVLWQALIGGARRLEVEGEGCLDEACQLDAAKNQTALSLLHSRLVQYDGNCVLLGVLYDVESKASEWGFVGRFPCSPEGVNDAATQLASAFQKREPPAADRALLVVTPVQHKMNDLLWASESFGEYLTTLLAEAGLKMAPATLVASPLVSKNAPLHTACGNKSCPLELGGALGAAMAVAPQVNTKGKSCELEAKVYTLGKKPTSQSQKAQGGCSAKDLAETIYALSLPAKIKPPAPPPPPPPPAEAPPAEAAPAEPAPAEGDAEAPAPPPPAADDEGLK